ncbi:hypothetical protein K491DRAFT_253882 [Lophiostoma macrostomum CBS 122681]|uniref:Uncharacterized protein n=1 Tax=Lophiostoma macrostomum CBS 122681 TaxID=1314788 RepID=A0A6A6TG37_9PLEO|nr:hypothetical protein K491DRAFT_253882 [Lophiostoma macrostomum CBS 122681]
MPERSPVSNRPPDNIANLDNAVAMIKEELVAERARSKKASHEKRAMQDFLDQMNGWWSVFENVREVIRNAQLPREWDGNQRMFDRLMRSCRRLEEGLEIWEERYLDRNKTVFGRKVSVMDEWFQKSKAEYELQNWRDIIRTWRAAHKTTFTRGDSGVPGGPKDTEGAYGA